MIKPENLKIVTVSFVLISFCIAFVARVVFEILSVAFGFFANFYGMDIFRHGVPISFGVGSFLFFQLSPSYKKLADEVVTEVRKVVWVGKKELYSMTLLVSVILIVSGFVLGLFDLVAGTGVRFFMD
ncbi:MAG: preprotein translocase subunit SecE [Bdellovibrionales bacterium]|nr:preprotein translocase subunit SecE [Bdellovibrionales bacterium]